MPGEGSEEQIGKSSESSDLDLIHGVAEGCQESFRLLFGRWASRLGRFLTRATGSPETAEDLLRHLIDGPHPAGDYRLEWDGRNDEGRKVSAGVYLARVEKSDGLAVGRVVLAW